MNLVDLLQGDGFELNRVAATHGGEYCGPCPRCSGHDRFRAWPHSPNSKGGVSGVVAATGAETLLNT